MFKVGNYLELIIKDLKGITVPPRILINFFGEPNFSYIPCCRIQDMKTVRLMWQYADVYILSLLWFATKRSFIVQWNFGLLLNRASLLKGVHPIIFVLNIFPNLHLIQKCIHNHQLFWNICWLCIHFWIKWELGKFFDTKMIGWSLFIRNGKKVQM